MKSPKVTQTFRKSPKHLISWLLIHLECNSGHFQKIERLSVVLYDKTSSLSLVNEAREELFCRKNRNVGNIPPTQNALLQHTKRSIYQAGIWTTSYLAHQVLPSPSEFAWSIKESTRKYVGTYLDDNT